MAFVLLLFALLNAVVAVPPGVPYPSCIPMTEENKAKLNNMTDEIVDFLSTLANRYQDFDITSVKLKIDRHYLNDGDDKDTELEFTVNSCDMTNVADDVDDDDVVTDDTNTDETDPEADANSITVLNLPKNEREMFSYLGKKKGPRPFLMYINGLKQLILL